MKLTYYGHSTFLIEIKEDRILVDPFISQNPLAKQIDISKIQPTYILLTHAHFDHVADVEGIAKQNKVPIIANYEIVTWFEKYKELKGIPLNSGGVLKLPFVHIKGVNAIHTSSFHDGSYGGNPMGFVLWNDNNSIYIAGDTALTMDMKLIPLTCPALDACILPIGDQFTMGHKDALIASEFVDCHKIIGCHYDTFDAIKIDKQAATQTFADKGRELVLMDIGNSIEI